MRTTWVLVGLLHLLPAVATAQETSGDIRGRVRRQRIFGSLGRFYQQQPLALASGYFVDYVGIVRTYCADPRPPGAPLVDSISFSRLEEDYANSITGLKVEHFDELSLGYERLLTTTREER